MPILYTMSEVISKTRLTEKKGKVITRKEVKLFNDLFPEYEGSVLNCRDIIDVVRAFNNNIALETTINPYGVILPNRIGIVLINNAGRSKKKPIDFKRTAELGYTVYHKNWDTDNNLMRITYLNNTRKSVVKNVKLFTFNATRTFKEVASAHFRKNWQRCLRLNYKPIQ